MTLSVPARLALFALALTVAPFGVRADVLDDALERGTLRIGVSEFVPWTMQDDAGELVGFEIDIGQRIAEDMGVEASFTLLPWEDVIGALIEGDIDMIAAGMAITPGRALQVEFSQPYFESGVSLATNTAMTAEFASLDAMNTAEVVITTVADTLAFDVTQRVFDGADVQVLPSADLAEAEVLEGRAHGYVASLPEVRFLALANPETIDEPLGDPLVRSRAGFAVKKGEQAMLNFLNAWIVAREADRWLPTAHGYWFGSLDWVEAEAP
ncbi:MAG: transporter substrate-binding domain-containing protein [Pseudomonadota bacterium]